MVIAHGFQDLFDIPSNTTALTLPAIKENPLKVQFQKCEEVKTEYVGQNPAWPFAASEVFDACVYSSRRLTARSGDCKDVYEVTFDITSSNITFKPGDTIGIVPQNTKEEVDKIITHLDLNTHADTFYELHLESTSKGAKIPPHVPVKSSIRHVLTYCLDIRSVLKKLFILALSRHTKDENERKALEYLCSKEGAVSYTTHILNKNLSLLDLFEIFHSCKPPIELLLANLPRLLPRPYSIASSYLKDKNKIKICFSVINIGNNRKGLTTGWLENMLSSEGNLEDKMANLKLTKEKRGAIKAPIYLRKNMSGFEMPRNLDTPLLLIGPGTGVAPYLGFLEERSVLKQKHPDFNLGEIWLFFGCRDPKLDFIYETELKSYLEDSTLDKLSTSFSRVKGDWKYVQDALKANGEEVVKFIKGGASIFVCGDLKSMATGVRETLEQCLVDHGQKTQEDAEKYIAMLQKDKRYFVDVWT